MASKWFYRVDGREHGPVSSNEIRELAISGRLRPTDQIRKDGSDDWRVAGESAKLFPGGVSNIREAVTELAADFTAADANKVFSAAAATAGQAAAKTGTTLKTHASAMKASAALTAEKTKITSLSLPAAYSALGKHCYEAGIGRTSFSGEFTELDALAGSLDSLRNQKTSSPAPTTFTDKARHLAGQGMDFANTQKLSLQQNASFARLGKAIYECDDHALAPADLRTPIDTLHSRLKEIDQALATHKGVWSANGQGLSPLILGASVLLFWPVGLFLLWKHPTLSRDRGWWAAGIAWALLVMVGVGRLPGPTDLIVSFSSSPAAKGRPLTVSVKGNALDRLYKNDIETRTSLLGNVNAWATESTVVVTFDMNTSDWSKINQGYQLMIRLFDKNGQHLTNVITSERFTPESRLTENKSASIGLGGGQPLVLLKAKGNILEYPVSVRDLRDTAMAEVGFFNPKIWGS